MENGVKTGLKVSRGVQLAGVVLMLVGIVSCVNLRQAHTPPDVFQMVLGLTGGFVLIIGARIYEWFTKP